MEPDVDPSRPRYGRAAISVDKIDKQSAARVCSRLCMGSAGMVAWLGFFWLGLEWSRHRLTRELATYSNRGVHRCRRIILHGRVCQRHRADNSEASNS